MQLLLDSYLKLSRKSTIYRQTDVNEKQTVFIDA